ncbi:hypothetical protein [Succinimonas sp.]
MGLLLNSGLVSVLFPESLKTPPRKKHVNLTVNLFLDMKERV